MHKFLREARLTRLALVFLLSFAIAAIMGCASAEPIPEPEPEPEPIVEQPQEPVNIADQRVIEPVLMAPDPITIPFNYQRARLLQESMDSIDTMLSSVEYPERLNYTVEGYTCNQGDPEYNEMLSLWRAELVRDYLVEKGIPDSSISVFGYGQKEPAFSNRTRAGRVKNRRVVITPSAP